MSNEEMQKELESLRLEVASLSNARARELKKANAEEELPPAAKSGVAETASVVEAAAIDVNDPDAVRTHMDNLLEQLEREIKDLPAVTTLAVFSLGVLFGRLLR